MRRSIKSGFTALCILLATAAWYYYSWKSQNSVLVEAASEATRVRVGAFERLKPCRWEFDRRNDGDSFRVGHGRESYVFRLYFVDCPEKHLSQLNRKRLSDQAKAMGGLSLEETVAVGEEARDFTSRILESGNFTVYTQWEAVFESERFYAMIEVDHEGRRRFLSELLAEQRLCRVYTKGPVDLPEGSSGREYKKELRDLVGRAGKR